MMYVVTMMASTVATCVVLAFSITTAMVVIVTAASRLPRISTHSRLGSSAWIFNGCLMMSVVVSVVCVVSVIVAPPLVFGFRFLPKRGLYLRRV